jgi:hypothetical protein
LAGVQPTIDEWAAAAAEMYAKQAEAGKSLDWIAENQPPDPELVKELNRTERYLAQFERDRQPPSKIGVALMEVDLWAEANKA